jgi:DNA replication ATP-dependent helicase Dna2
MLLSNKLIYGDRLLCGSEIVAKRSLVLPDAGFLHHIHDEGNGFCGGGCWMENILSEK